MSVSRETVLFLLSVNVLACSKIDIKSSFFSGVLSAPSFGRLYNAFVAFCLMPAPRDNSKSNSDRQNSHYASFSTTFAKVSIQRRGL